MSNNLKTIEHLKECMNARGQNYVSLSDQQIKKGIQMYQLTMILNIQQNPTLKKLEPPNICNKNELIE